MQNQKKSVGPVFGIIIILLVILIGGFYFSRQKIQLANQTDQMLQAGTSTSAASAYDLSAINQAIKELNATTTEPDLNF